MIWPVWFTVICSVKKPYVCCYWSHCLIEKHTFGAGNWQTLEFRALAVPSSIQSGSVSAVQFTESPPPPTATTRSHVWGGITWVSVLLSPLLSFLFHFLPTFPILCLLCSCFGSSIGCFTFLYHIYLCVHCDLRQSHRDFISQKRRIAYRKQRHAMWFCPNHEWPRLNK